jgi:hypothetical protein
MNSKGFSLPLAVLKVKYIFLFFDILLVMVVDGFRILVVSFPQWFSQTSSIAPSIAFFIFNLLGVDNIGRHEIDN